MASYIGQDDYRGYLNKLTTTKDPYAAYAGSLLQKGGVGNDAVFGNTKYGTAQAGNTNKTLAQINKELYKRYSGGGDELTKRMSNLLAGLGGGSSQVYAPSLDIAGINAQARKAAAAGVNPYYTKALNQFLKEQAFNKQTKQTQYATDVKNYEDVLANTLAGNETNRQRTTEDVATNLGEINTQADQFQTDSGQQFEDTRNALGQDVSASGLGHSGLGKRQVSRTLADANTAEGRQEQQFQQSRTQQELFKGRSLDDLLKGDELAKTTKEKGVKQSKFDLDTYMKQLSFDTTNKKNELEKSRQSDLASRTAAERSKRVAKFVEGIANPAQKAAAYSQYGGYL